MGFTKRSYTLVACISLSTALVGFAKAGEYRMVLESRTSTAAPFDVFSATFDSYNDIVNANLNSAQTDYTQIQVSPSYQITGLTYDGKYRMMLESRTSTSAPFDIYMGTFDSYSDLLNGNLDGSGSNYTQIQVSPSYQIVGLAYDGKYRVAIESRTSTSAPFDLYMGTFDTYNDLLNGNLDSSQSGYTQIQVSPSYQVVGLTYDGQYRVVLESRTSTSAPFDVYMGTFDSYSDLLNGNIDGAGSNYTQIQVSPDYQIAGLAYEPQAVPEPVSLTGLSLGAIAILCRRRKG